MEGSKASSSEISENCSSLLFEKRPLGFILLANGSLRPFGLLPPELEAKDFEDPVIWKEVKVCPPIWLLTLGDPNALTCPADFCQEKLKKNISFESHLKKHLSLIAGEQKIAGRLNGSCDLPPNISIKYYCSEKTCSNGNPVSDESRNFGRLKYLKQHYLKVHAPKTFECKSCEKSFSTLAFLGIHNRMCGNSFNCSDCNAKYSTLEALQTHCRRKEHVYDYTKYRDIINTLKLETNAKKAEETMLKQKLAAVSLSMPTKPIAIAPKKTPQIPMLIPRPTEITTCGPGSVTHVTWTFEQCVGNAIPKLKVEIGTQTNPTETGFYSSVETSYSTKNHSSLQGSRQSKRKKSAETQTGKLRFSIETQTLNVVKRRRSSKKQIAEAETQCPLVESFPRHQRPTEIKSKTEEYNYNGEVETEMDKIEIISSNNLPLPLPTLAPVVGMDIEMEALNAVSLATVPEPVKEKSRSDIDFSTVVTTSEMCVGNRFDEVAQQLFDFEEFHRETQTDLVLFPSVNDNWENILDIGIKENDISDILNVVTAETQTWPGIYPRPEMESNVDTSNALNDNAVNTLNWNSSPYHPMGLQTDYLWSSDDYALSPHSSPEGSANNPNYMETMDSETQTPAADCNNFDIGIAALLKGVLSSPGFN